MVLILKFKEIAMKENINKYYIPEYSDIYIGQDLYTINEHKIDLSTVDSLTAFLQYQNFYKDCEGNITYGINLENYRLKYLDSSDIEELGFIFEEQVVGKITFKYTKNNFIELHKLYTTILILNNGRTIFEGFIKNKSELIRLLGWLNV